MVDGLLAGEPDLWLLLFFLLLLLLALPCFSTLVLVLRGGRRRWRIDQTTLLGLAIAASALIALLRTHWALWGVWLYICAAASMLLLEIYGGRKPEIHA
jgi:O-antigen/teichoic acid export membrane protein